MAEVAKMFGKKLGEEFCVKSCHPEGNCVGCFSKYGFEGHNQTATAHVALFLLLLTGQPVIEC
jgi:hypothetical protein